MNRDYINNGTLLALVILISVIFLVMIRSFLMPLFMAGLFSAMARPAYLWLNDRLGGRKMLASVLTIVAIIILILAPLSLLIAVITAQAISVGQTVRPYIQEMINEPRSFFHSVEQLPFYDQLIPYQTIIIERLGQLATTISNFLINSLSSFTLVTINAIIGTIIMLYVMFFFFTMGDKLLAKILYFLPLQDHDEQRLLSKFTSVTRATIKGMVIIGALQGAICGFGFWLAGIEGPVFWGSLMAVCSVIPAFGTAIVWIPATIIMGVSGKFAGVAILIVCCGLIAGNLDNLLRPRLVGKDTQMHDLFVLFSTLGGISMFGILGIIIGPIIAALFITVWEMYGDVFKRFLPEVKMQINGQNPSAATAASGADTPDTES
jgi:predicted PurR-regulated permease PerM